MATVLERVRGLIERLSPEPICDDCIAQELDRPKRQHANRKSRELAGGAGFERRKDICSLLLRREDGHQAYRFLTESAD